MSKLGCSPLLTSAAKAQSPVQRGLHRRILEVRFPIRSLLTERKRHSSSARTKRNSAVLLQRHPNFVGHHAPGLCPRNRSAGKVTARGACLRRPRAGRCSHYPIRRPVPIFVRVGGLGGGPLGDRRMPRRRARGIQLCHHGQHLNPSTPESVMSPISHCAALPVLLVSANYW